MVLKEIPYEENVSSNVGSYHKDQAVNEKSEWDGFWRKWHRRKHRQQLIQEA
jgi:hypothetical protein